MLYSRILRGFRMFRRLRAAWLLLIALNFVQGTTWYCKDTLCSEPMSKGLAGYEYNPSEAAIQNGYLPVSPGKVLTAYKVSNTPDIYEVEVDGKRGFVPRTLFDVSTNFMGSAEFVVTEGPNILSEQDATFPTTVQPSVDQVVTSTEKPQPQEESLLSSTVSPFLPNQEINQINNRVDELLPTQETADVVPQQTVSVPAAQNLEKEIVAEKIAETVEEVKPEEILISKPAEQKNLSEEERPIVPVVQPTADENAAQFETPSAVSESTSTKTPLVEATTGISVAAVSESASTTTPLVESTTGIPVPPPYHSTEDISRGLSDAAIEEAKKEIGGATVAQTVDDNSVQLNESSDLSEKKEFFPKSGLEENLVKVNETVLTEKPVEEKFVEEKSVEIRPAMDLEGSPKIPLEISTPPLPVTISGDLDEIAKKLSGANTATPPPPQPPTTQPPSSGEPLTVSTTLSGNSVSDSSVGNIVASPVEKRPEPTVVFQQADYRASLPGFYQHKADQPVVSTKAFLRHHHHNHDHGHAHHHHGHSHHDHAHHDHDHSHDEHDHHDGHDHHDHSHSGAHDHDHDDSAERSHQVRRGVVAPPATETKLDVTKESLAGQIHRHDVLSTDHASTGTVVISKPQFIPPENATGSPVDYEQLVRDRMEGKTQPGLLTDEYKKDPSEGVATPPQLDPSTATEAPRIPGFSENVLPSSEEKAAIENNPRYNRRRPGQSEGNPQHQLGASSGVLELPHSHSHGEENRDENDFRGEKLVESSTNEGTCRSGSVAGEGSCEEFVDFGTEASVSSVSHVPSSNQTEATWNSYLDMTAEKMIHGWMTLVVLFERTSGTLRLAGMFIFAIFSLVSMLSAAADRSTRRTLERGFEEYDYKKEKELLTLREQVQVLLKQNQDLVSTVAPPPIGPPIGQVVPPLTGPPIGAPPLQPAPQRQVSLPCADCDGLRSSLQQLNRTIGDQEQNLTDQRKSHSTLLSRNNEVVTELRLMQKDRDEMARQLDELRSRFAEAERRLRTTTPLRSAENGKRADGDPDTAGLLLRLQQLEAENTSLRENVARDQSSDVRLLRQLLAEKEEEIRKIHATDVAGSRDLQEKSEDLRAAKKQVVRLQQELESVKRDRETQLQIRCQTFRSAADKAQRDALMARQEALAARQQLEDVCRRHGEQVPNLVSVGVANGAVTPPGMMPLMFAGVGFPSGPPPASLEAFKQQVLMQQQTHSSGHSSPRSPDHSDRDRGREKRTVKKSHTLDFSKNGKDANDLDEARKRDRSYR